MANLLMRAKATACVSRDSTVMDAIRLMAEKRIGAVLVLQEERPLGIFTERDLMLKVVLEKLDPEKTTIGDVMTTPVVPVAEDADITHALGLMLDAHIRHLPLVDREGRVKGMLSMRHLMREQIERLEQQVGALANYLGQDGPGG